MIKKHKVKKSAVKRFKITKSGKILHRAAASRHLKTTKSKRRLRAMKRPKEVLGKYKRNIQKMLGIKKRINTNLHKLH